MYRVIILLVLLSSPLAAQTHAVRRSQTAPSAMQGPADVLRKLLTDPATADTSVAALTSTGDPELLPLFAAMAAKGDLARRSLAVSAAAKLGEGDPSTAIQTGAADILYDRVCNDVSADVRAEALGQLIALKGISDDRLAELLKSDDQNLQCLAARAMIRHGKEGPPVETLKNLTGSAAVAVASLARVTLLGKGDASQLAPLSAVLTDPATPEPLVILLLQQIIEEKVAAAGPVAAKIAAGAESVPLKVRAYHAAAAVSAKGPALLAEAIAKSNHTLVRAQLLQILADMPDARPALEKIARGDDAVAKLAKLELFRTAGDAEGPAGSDAAAKAACDAVASGHAMVIDYVLGRARQDITRSTELTDKVAKPASSAFYAPALIAVLNSVQVSSPIMLPEHTQAAQAAELLGELATPQAAQTVTAILNGHYNALARAVAAGLLRCKNKAVCDWMAPLLASPYDELATDAALTLGQHGDGRAAAELQDILAHSRRYPPEMTALAAWDLVKLSGQTKPTVAALCETIK
ncbi:MAG: hypothetical protein ABSH10_07050 [Phycisphaerae bacterium]|jgi:hypothetical protein